MKKITIYNTAITLALGLSISAFTACESLDQGNLSELAENNLLRVTKMPKRWSMPFMLLT